MNNIIFLGGSYSSSKEMRKQISIQAKKIESIIRKCNFDPSYNLLSNENVHSDTNNVNNIYFHNQEPFESIAKNVLKNITEKEIKSMQGLRQFENEEDCKIAIKACNIALKQLKICIAAIFELSAISQGSYFEIATLLQQYQRPILCLSHKEFGRKFGKMINGHPSRLLRTIRYDDNNLEDIVTKFLTVEINKYKMVSFNFRLPSYLQSRIIELTNEGEYKSTSDFLRWLIQNYVDNYIR